MRKFNKSIVSNGIFGQEYLDELNKSDKIYENNEIIGFLLAFGRLTNN